MSLSFSTNNTLAFLAQTGTSIMFYDGIFYKKRALATVSTNTYKADPANNVLTASSYSSVTVDKIGRYSLTSVANKNYRLNISKGVDSDRFFFPTRVLGSDNFYTSQTIAATHVSGSTLKLLTIDTSTSPAQIFTSAPIELSYNGQPGVYPVDGYLALFRTSFLSVTLMSDNSLHIITVDAKSNVSRTRHMVDSVAAIAPYTDGVILLKRDSSLYFMKFEDFRETQITDRVIQGPAKMFTTETKLVIATDDTVVVFDFDLESSTLKISLKEHHDITSPLISMDSDSSVLLLSNWHSAKLIPIPEENKWSLQLVNHSIFSTGRTIGCYNHYHGKISYLPDIPRDATMVQFDGAAVVLRSTDFMYLVDLNLGNVIQKFDITPEWKTVACDNSGGFFIIAGDQLVKTSVGTISHTFSGEQVSPYGEVPDSIELIRFTTNGLCLIRNGSMLQVVQVSPEGFGVVGGLKLYEEEVNFRFLDHLDPSSSFYGGRCYLCCTNHFSILTSRRTIEIDCSGMKFNILNIKNTVSNIKNGFQFIHPESSKSYWLQYRTGFIEIVDPVNNHVVDLISAPSYSSFPVAYRNQICVLAGKEVVEIPFRNIGEDTLGSICGNESFWYQIVPSITSPTLADLRILLGGEVSFKSAHPTLLLSMINFCVRMANSVIFENIDFDLARIFGVETACKNAMLKLISNGIDFEKQHLYVRRIKYLLGDSFSEYNPRPAPMVTPVTAFVPKVSFTSADSEVSQAIEPADSTMTDAEWLKQMKLLAEQVEAKKIQIRVDPSIQEALSPAVEEVEPASPESGMDTGISPEFVPSDLRDISVSVSTTTSEETKPIDPLIGIFEGVFNSKVDWIMTYQRLMKISIGALISKNLSSGLFAAFSALRVADTDLRKQKMSASPESLIAWALLYPSQHITDVGILSYIVSILTPLETKIDVDIVKTLLSKLRQQCLGIAPAPVKNVPGILQKCSCGYPVSLVQRKCSKCKRTILIDKKTLKPYFE